jgi:hypothetical protein
MAKMADYQTIAESIRTYWASRKLALLKYWDFYYGDSQRYYFDKFEGEDEQEYNNRVINAIVENHCAKTCDVLVSYLYGQPCAKSRVKVRAVDAEGEIISQLQELLGEVWEYNDLDSLRIDLALMSSVTGLGIVYKQYVDSETGLPFESDVAPEIKKKQGIVRYELFDTVDTMPLPIIDSKGVIYPRLLGGIVRFYNLDNFSGNTFLDRLMDKRWAQEEILEVFDGQKFIRSRIVTGENKPEIIDSVNNPYGNINTAFTLFRNYGDPMYLEGASDLAQMVSLQNALNGLVNDDKMTIDYHTFPILALMGGAKLPANFVRKVNSVLEMDTGQDAKYLTWDNVLEASANKQDSIRKQMTVVGGVSQISRGNAETIGQVRSGAGLKTLFQADINTIALKIPHFKKAERELAKSTLKMLAVERGIKLPDYYRIEVEFPDDFVGLDELLKAQVEQMDLANGVRTHREVIKSKHADIMSEEQVEDIIEENIEVRKKIVEAEKPPVQVTPGVKPGETSQAKSNEQGAGSADQDS